MPRVVDEVAPVGVGGAPDGQDRLRRRVGVDATRPRETKNMRPVGAELGPYLGEGAGPRSIEAYFTARRQGAGQGNRGTHRRRLRDSEGGRGAPRCRRQPRQLGDEERGWRRADPPSRGAPADYVYA